MPKAIDYKDPGVRPPWMKDEDALQAIEAEQQIAGLPPIRDVTAAPQVTRAAIERTAADVITLPDGRRCKLVKKLVLEMPGQVQGSVEKREQEFWTGPKQMKLIRSQELTAHGLLWQVWIGYPNHEPTLEDIRQIRAAFFPGCAEVNWVIPDAEATKRDPQLKMLVGLTEVPSVLATGLIHLPG